MEKCPALAAPSIPLAAAKSPPGGEEPANVKTMTCRQLGGPCDAEHRGTKADEVIKAQDKHLEEMVANGDEAHRDANDAMRNRWKHPIAGLGWYRQAKKDFAALPED
jgi:hypothetical protein